MKKMNKIVTFTITFLLMTGCSQWQKPYYDYSDVGKMTNQDYVDHLASLGESYLSFNKDRQEKISSQSKDYLNEIYHRIIQNNEIFLPKRETVFFNVIQHTTPFIFSLPRSQFFISSGLLKKFLKNEQLFVAALSREIIRSQRNLYERNVVLATGNMTTEQMLQLMKLDLATKEKINEWSYVVLRRSGFDSSALLAWIQLQNKNPLDFALYSGDRSQVSREEFAFKNFLVKEKKINSELITLDEKNSSKSFYKLLSEIRE
ncbi:MAG: hypothetical protein L6Q33_09870 [Bacteriovoracaceae bacterium]|nr:hypothetical protein [Bacteriovoracaceae bacterium]